MENQNPYIFKEVHCCICHGTGWVPKFRFWKRQCPVCNGKGVRQIIVPRYASEADQYRITLSAILGISL